jgi:glucose-6-phosphate isomerase
MLRCTRATLWKSLEDHAHSIRLHLPQNLIQSASDNRQQFNAYSSHIHLDYSNQHITTDTLELLISLADSCCLRDKINALIRGDVVNLSENRPALHTALRATDDTTILVNSKDIMPEIIAARKKMKGIVEQIRAKNWLGFSGKPINAIVNIGIGGSDLGPRFCLKALEEYTANDMSYHFISDADPNSFKNAVEKLSPETTLFIISSKSFTTQETLYNAKKAMEWIGATKKYERHFIAVTAHIEKAKFFGITTVLPIWEWIGGRYSFCSAINLISAIAIGFENFSKLLAGANNMDKHFQESHFSSNLPVLLALLGIWNNNFLHIHNLLFLTYTQHLEHFVPYIQQLDMESNGKSIDNQGKTVSHATAPIIWGGLGNQAQHSYYQLLCQGTHKVTADFISLNEYSGQIINTMCEAKFNVLSRGRHDQENPNGYISGNIPLNHIRIHEFTPFSIGALVALYEHKVFTQSVLWNINPFDQPGVESAKRNYLEQIAYTAAL